MNCGSMRVWPVLAVLTSLGAGCSSTVALDSVFERAYQAQLWGRQEEAIRLYEALLGDESATAAVWNNLGIAFLLQGKADTSLLALAIALDMDPNNLLTRYVVAVALTELGRFAEANQQIGQIRVMRQAVIDSTISRLGMPTYNGMDLRVVEPEFEQKLATLQDACARSHALTRPEVVAFVQQVSPLIALHRST